MSSGSHGSSASSRFRSGGTSPIPYRAPLLTSWTDAIPGRRYLCCSRATAATPRSAKRDRWHMEGENALLHMSLEQALCKAKRRQSFSSRLVAILLMVILFFICVSAWSGVPST
ncbi:hypothetical protein VPH35_010610 [Triticum aestivum]